MKHKKTFIWQLIIVFSMYLAGFLFLEKMPDMVPIHWDINNQPDNFARKEVAVWLFPSIALLVSFLFRLLPQMDPKKEKYAQFEKAWELFQLAFVLFFAYIYFVTIYATLTTEVNIGSFVLGGVGILFVIIGNYLAKIKQNYFIGIKTPWTLSNEDAWNKTHRLGGWCFVLSGILFLTSAILQKYFLTIFVVAILISTIFPIVYSYLVFRKK